jgi:hypothetical protein
MMGQTAHAWVGTPEVYRFIYRLAQGYVKLILQNLVAQILNRVLESMQTWINCITL